MCGLEVPLNPNNIGYYLSNGWPEHCGYTMSWVTERLLKLEREQAKVKGE
jgi:hypothetical protein